MNDETLEGFHLIDGQWVPGSGMELVSENPANGHRLWRGHEATASDVDRAVQVARRASIAWGDWTVEARTEVVREFGRRLTAEAETFTEHLIREVGKTRWDAASEVQAMQAKVEVTIEALQSRRSDYTVKLGELQGGVQYKPHGVTAVFGPFNFPGHISNGHILPALLAGNAVVFKPSELTPLAAYHLTELWLQAGLPSGVLNLVQGGKTTGEALVSHAGVNAILFTGSLAAGRAIARRVAERLDVLLALELGGNNPLIVHRVQNVEAAVYETIRSAYLSGGQRCTCARRLIVTDGNADFLQRLQTQIRRLTIGWPDADPQPFLGPLIHARAVQNLLARQTQLREQGAEVLIEAGPLPLGPAFVSPGLIDITEVSDPPDEEVFGPLLQVQRVPDLAAAIRCANETRYGLVAGLLTDDRADYEVFRSEVRAGLINWNTATTGASGKLPFGGVGLSGNHRPAGFFTVDCCNLPVASLERTELTFPQTLLPGMDW